MKTLFIFSIALFFLYARNNPFLAPMNFMQKQENIDSIEQNINELKQKDLIVDKNTTKIELYSGDIRLNLNNHAIKSQYDKGAIIIEFEENSTKENAITKNDIKEKIDKNTTITKANHDITKNKEQNITKIKSISTVKANHDINITKIKIIKNTTKAKPVDKNTTKIKIADKNQTIKPNIIEKQTVKNVDFVNYNFKNIVEFNLGKQAIYLKLSKKDTNINFDKNLKTFEIKVNIAKNFKPKIRKINFGIFRKINIKSFETYYIMTFSLDKVYKFSIYDNKKVMMVKFFK